MDQEKLIFIISPSRTGSTLLQRLLANSSDIYVGAESWIMLHPLYALKKNKIKVEYQHELASDALHYLIESNHLDKNIFYEAIRQYGLSIYSSVLLASNKQFFLDKTPPYTRIIDELPLVFPKAKYIFLIRNPLSILHSFLNAWVKTDLSNFYWTNYDLLQSPIDWVTGWENMHEHSVRLSYESLVNEPERELLNIYNYTNVTPPKNIKSYTSHAEHLGAFFGDIKGIYENDEPNHQYTEKWLELADNPQSFHLAVSYIKKLGPCVIEKLGYDYESILDRLDTRAKAKNVLEKDAKLNWNIIIKHPHERTRKDNIKLLRYRQKIQSSSGSKRLSVYTQYWKNFIYNKF